MRRSLLTCLLVLLSATADARADDPAPQPDLVAAVAAAADAPAATTRRQLAERLASRTDVALDAWVAAVRAQRPTSPAVPGAATVRVVLRVGDADEPTEIATFVPSSLPTDAPAPLLLALHGSGGAAGDMIELWRGVAEASGWIVLAPTEAGPNTGYRFTPRERESSLATLRWARRRFLVDPDRVVVTGVSRGGHLSWDLALRQPDLFAAVVPMIGAPRLSPQGGQNNMRYLENLAGARILDLQGALDDPLAVENLRISFERLQALGARSVRLLEFPDRGHDFDFAAVDWKEFLASAHRDPAPTRVVRRAATKGEGRAAWVEVLETDPAIREEPPPAAIGGWEQMDESARRRAMAAYVESRTARLEAEVKSPGRFEVKSSGVKRFRLLLPASLLPPADRPSRTVTVEWNGRSVSRPATPSAGVLLRDFVERLDPAFLPVVEVSLP